MFGQFKEFYLEYSVGKSKNPQQAKSSESNLVFEQITEKGIEDKT